MSDQTGYLAPLHLQQQLETELQGITAKYGRLFLAKGPAQRVYFAENIWFHPEIIHFTSINEAANKLKALQRLWALYPYQEIRRSELIQTRLPYFAPRPLQFGSIPPKKPLGSWTLLNETTLLASANCSSLFANGQVHFQETSVPPSRAYLKLWELFTRTETKPKAGEICLDLGASPGSWSFVLQSLGASVIAVDKAPLAPEIACLPGITSLKRDGFTLKPEDLPPLNWVFSDMICYPEKLLSFLQPYLLSFPKASFVCTLKFQGKRDYEIVKEFEKIKGSQVFHLFHNKHELTWFKPGLMERITVTSP